MQRLYLLTENTEKLKQDGFFFYSSCFRTNCIYAASASCFGFCHSNSAQFALLGTPATDDFNSVLLAALLVPALPADGETTLAQWRPLKTQLIV